MQDWGFAILFKYFQYECQFPKHKRQFPKQVIQYIAKQIDTEDYMLENYTLNERRVRHHKMQIRNYFGFRLPNNDDSEKVNSLDSLNKDIAKNPKVRIITKGNGWISISPSEPQAEPQNLMKLKSQITSKWPMTNLLDVLKETDLQLSFTDNFKTMGVREQLNRRIIQKRLILALYGSNLRFVKGLYESMSCFSIFL